MKPTSILQFDEHVITRLRVHRSAKGVDVVAFDQERGAWSAHDGSLEAALKAFAAKHNLAEDLVYTVLPRHEMTARILELPSDNPQELLAMIRLSAEEYVPFPLDELVIDQCILYKTSEGLSKVLAVFAHRDVVETHLSLLRNAGIEPTQIYLSTACLASAAVAAAPEQDGRRWALVNLASGGLEVVVLNGKRLEYGRAVASSHDWSLDAHADEILEELRLEASASLSAYRRESEEGEGVGAIYLCSESQDVTAHCEALAQQLGLDCAPAAFARTLIARGAESVPALPLVSLGAALIAQDHGAVAIRLLPESVIHARARTGLKKKSIQYAVLAAVALLGLLGLYAQAVHKRQAYIVELRGQIAAIEPRAQGIVSKQRQLTILRDQVERSGSVVQLLAALCELFPTSGMNITRLVFGHNEGIQIWGRAKELQQVEKFAEKLSAAGKAALPQFARATRAYEIEDGERGQKVLDYKIVIPFPEAAGPPSGGDGVE